jgi:hypothetical protein
MEKLKTLLIANRGEIAVRDPVHITTPHRSLGIVPENNYLTGTPLLGPHYQNSKSSRYPHHINLLGSRCS